jgi:hypothetical protein
VPYDTRHIPAHEMSNKSELATGSLEPSHIVQISENVLREKLVGLADSDSRPLIAVDLDDVLCQTTACVADCALVLTHLVIHWMTRRAVQGIIASLRRTCK